MEDAYTILEVANMLEITTQAVYKRLQQDSVKLEDYLTTKGGKKSLQKAGIIVLADLMGLDNPFAEKAETASKYPEDAKDSITNDSQQELLNYLRNDNKRMQNEINELKSELQRVQEYRENDRRVAEEERRQYEESRMRADTLLMKAMLNQQPPRLLDRIFKRKPKEDAEEKKE